MTPNTKHQTLGTLWVIGALLVLFASLNVLFYSSCQKEELSINSTPPDNASCMVDKDRVTQNLKNMSYGLIKALHTLGRGNTKTEETNDLATFNQIVVENAVRGLHGYYYVTVDRLLNECAQAGINLDSLINDALSSESGTQGFNIAAILLENNLNGTSFTYHIVVPYLDMLLGKTENESGELNNIVAADKEALGSTMPRISWDVWSGHYPVMGYYLNTSGQIATISIEKSDAQTGYTIFTGAVALQECLLDGLTCAAVINNCAPAYATCKNCTDVATPTEFNANANGSMENYEVEINLDKLNNDIGDASNSNDCYYLTMDEPWMYYAELSAYINECQFFEADYNGSLGTLTKVQWPIRAMSSQTGDDVMTYGSVLKLCEETTTFFTYGDGSAGTDPGLAPGGLYCLSRLGLPNLYFAQPYGEGLWHSGNPDMRLIFALDRDESQVCPGPSFMPAKSDVDPYYGFSCMFYPCSHEADSPNNPLGVEQNLIIGTELAPMLAYWSKNAISVGFRHTSFSRVAKDNVLEIATTDTQNSTAPAGLGAPIGSLLKTYNPGTDSEEYEFMRHFSDGNIRHAGDELVVHLYATFFDGSVINHYFDLTLSGNAGGSEDINYMNAFIRGRIMDYQIDVYDAP